MFLSESDHCLYKFQKTLILFEPLPIDPAYGIVLTISIIISILGITDLISSIDHRNTLAEQYHEKSISKLLFSKLPNIHLTCRTFYSTVPGIIIAAAILIVLIVSLIMTIIISHHIIQGKSILTGHIVDHCISVRISPHMPGSSFYHLLVTFQETAHILEKSRIILSHTFMGRFFLSSNIPFIKSVEHQLTVTENTILHQKLYRCSIS